MFFISIFHIFTQAFVKIKCTNLFVVVVWAFIFAETLSFSPQFGLNFKK